MLSSWIVRHKSRGKMTASTHRPMGKAWRQAYAVVATYKPKPGWGQTSRMAIHWSEDKGGTGPTRQRLEADKAYSNVRVVKAKPWEPAWERKARELAAATASLVKMDKAKVAKAKAKKTEEARRKKAKAAKKARAAKKAKTTKLPLFGGLF